MKNIIRRLQSGAAQKTKPREQSAEPSQGAVGEVTKPENSHHSRRLIHLPKCFDRTQLVPLLVKILSEDHGQWVQYYQKADNHLIQYGTQSKLIQKLTPTPSCHLYLHMDQQQLSLQFQFGDRVDHFPEPIPKPAHRLKSALGESYEPKLVSGVMDQLVKAFADRPLNLAEVLRNGRGPLIQPVDPACLGLVLDSLAPRESPLAWLAIDKLKQSPFPLDQSALHHTYYLLTTHQSKLLGFDKEWRPLLGADLPATAPTYHAEMGRDRMVSGGFVWLTARQQAKGFRHAVAIAAESSPLDRLFAFFHHFWPNGGSANAALVQTLLDSGVLAEHPAYPLLCLLIAQQQQDVQTQKDPQVLRLQVDWNQNCDRLLAMADAAECIEDWFTRWNTALPDQISLTQFLVHESLAKDGSANLLPLHRQLRRRFHQTEKESIKRAVFDLEFCGHLIHRGYNQEAQSLLEAGLAVLPDETMQELLPPKNLDLTGSESGQVLRLAHLDLLLEAMGPTEPLLLQCAQLQPLAPSRMAALAENSSPSVAESAMAIRHLLRPEGLKPMEENTIDDLEPFSQQTLKEVIPHPAARDHGWFDKLQSWLGEVTTPDYTAIRSFAEPVTAHAHPQLSRHVVEVSRALGLKAVPAYIAHGEKGFGLQAFEGEPSFLMVGSHHLDPKKTGYLRDAEWRFALGVELAHLHYKHARLTTDEVWRGAADKGFFVLDTLLAILPMGQFLGKTLSGVTRLNSLAGVLKASDKVMGVASTGRDVFEKVNMVSDFYNQKMEKFSGSNAKERQLSAASRLMQLTADRAGLLCCKQLRPAIRAMFLTDLKLVEELPRAQHHGLLEVLLIQETNGDYRFQELAIRVAALISFYLSAEFRTLQGTVTVHQDLAT